MHMDMTVISIPFLIIFFGMQKLVAFALNVV